MFLGWKEAQQWIKVDNSYETTAAYVFDVMHGFQHIYLQITMKKRLGVNIPHSFYNLSKNVHNGRFIDLAV